MITATTTVLDHEQLASDGARVRDLFAGAIALLSGECPATSVNAARSTLLEARALVAGVVDALEGLAAIEAEARRSVHAQAGKHVAQAVRR